MFYKRLRAAAFFMLLLILPSAYLVSQLSADNRQEKLANQSGPAAQLYRQFKQDFGHDEFVIAALTVLICGGLTLLYTMAVVQLVGWQMNLITSSLPLVLFVLAIANGIHVARHFQRTLHDTTDPVEAMRTTLSELRRSCPGITNLQNPTPSFQRD